MITFVIVGKTKDMAVRDLVDEYLRRISMYRKVLSVVIKEERRPDHIEREGQRIIDSLPSGKVMVCDKKGEMISSEDMAEILKDQRVTFVVGGPEGLSDQVRDRADKVISFSKMTFPHELFYGMLCEQVYRGLTILRGEKYHKA